MGGLDRYCIPWHCCIKISQSLSLLQARYGISRSHERELSRVLSASYAYTYTRIQYELQVYDVILLRVPCRPPVPLSLVDMHWLTYHRPRGCSNVQSAMLRKGSWTAGFPKDLCEPERTHLLPSSVGILEGKSAVIVLA